jgi:hypothetical protein
MTEERDIPADEPEPETPIADADKGDDDPDDKRDVGVGTDEEG